MNQISYSDPKSYSIWRDGKDLGLEAVGHELDVVASPVVQGKIKFFLADGNTAVFSTKDCDIRFDNENERILVTPRTWGLGCADGTGLCLAEAL